MILNPLSPDSELEPSGPLIIKASEPMTPEHMSPVSWALGLEPRSPWAPEPISSRALEPLSLEPWAPEPKPLSHEPCARTQKPQSPGAPEPRPMSPWPLSSRSRSPWALESQNLSLWAVKSWSLEPMSSGLMSPELLKKFPHRIPLHLNPQRERRTVRCQEHDKNQPNIILTQQRNWIRSSWQLVRHHHHWKLITLITFPSVIKTHKW